MPLELTPQTWHRIKSVTADALERPLAEREAFVVSQCDGDDALAAEVLAIVRSAAIADEFLEGSIAPTTSGAAEAGARFGAWRLVRPLGHGGMASVYLAERADSAFTQRAAVKVVRGFFADGLLGRRFDDERRILASLEHPNIARFIDGGATPDGVPYVTLEYVDGVRIDEFCQSRALSLRARLALFRQVCSAVEYAHQRLIVHRDIKASNILVGADGIPKLLDFGIAKLIDPATLQERTHTLLRVATPESASPEQLRGESVTTATDIYSLGVLLYRLVTGVSPYRGPLTTEMELVRAVCEETPVPPSHLTAATSSWVSTTRLNWRRLDDVDHIVLKALRKEPERRYASVQELSADVQRYLDGRPVNAAPDSRAYRLRKYLARHRAAVAAAAVLVIAVAAGISATAWQARAASRERARAQAQFDAVRSLANAVLGDVFSAIASLPGSGPAQRVVLAHATEYFEKLVQQAADDVVLQSEIAGGYIRLAQIQGMPGMPNLGDRNGARDSYEKAAALLEPLVSRSTDPAIRFQLAETYSRLGTLTDDPDAKLARYRAGLALVDSPPADARLLGIVQALWSEVGNLHVAANRFGDAEQASREAVAVAQAAYALAPQDLSVSRNLSLALKTKGALLVHRGSPDAGLVEFEKARDLDLMRIERQPERGLWKLDLSFAYESIASALEPKGEPQRALDASREAVRLRQQAVDADPEDEFASSALARGHASVAQRLAKVPDIDGVLASLEAQLQVLRGRLDAHPERANLWLEYGAGAFAAVQLGVNLLESHPGRPQAAVSRVRAMVEDLRVRRAPNGAPLVDNDAALTALTARVHALR